MEMYEAYQTQNDENSNYNSIGDTKYQYNIIYKLPTTWIR